MRCVLKIISSLNQERYVFLPFGYIQFHFKVNDYFGKFLDEIQDKIT